MPTKNNSKKVLKQHQTTPNPTPATAKESTTKVNKNFPATP